MKKLNVIIACNFMLASSSMAAMNPNVTLSGGGDVPPATQVSIPLTGLVPSATYYVICYITASELFLIVRLGSNFTDTTSSVSSYALNGNNVTQGQLNIGSNTAVTVGNFTNPSTASVTFTNLDQDYTFNVGGCYATPVVG